MLDGSYDWWDVVHHIFLWQNGCTFFLQVKSDILGEDQNALSLSKRCWFGVGKEASSLIVFFLVCWFKNVAFEF